MESEEGGGASAVATSPPVRTPLHPGFYDGELGTLRIWSAGDAQYAAFGWPARDGSRMCRGEVVVSNDSARLARTSFRSPREWDESCSVSLKTDGADVVAVGSISGVFARRRDGALDGRYVTEAGATLSVRNSVAEVFAFDAVLEDRARGVGLTFRASEVDFWSDGAAIQTAKASLDGCDLVLLVHREASAFSFQLVPAGTDACERFRAYDDVTFARSYNAGRP